MTHGVRLVIEHALADAFPQAVLDRGPPNGSIIIKDERGDRYTVSVQPVLAGSVDAQIADKLGVTNDPLGLEPREPAQRLARKPGARWVDDRDVRMSRALVKVVERLPRNETLHKILKYKLRDELAAKPWP